MGVPAPRFMNAVDIHDLQQENLRLKKLINTLDGGVIVEDQARQIILINQVFCNMFGIPVSPESLVGTDCADSMENSKTLLRDPAWFLQRIDAILRERLPVFGETLDLRDGRVFSRDYVPVYDEDQYIGHLWHYRDVTQFVQSQRRIERLLKVEEVNREIVRLFLQLENVDVVINEVLAMTGYLLDASRAYVFRFRETVRLLDNTYEWCAPGVMPEIENLQGLPFDELVPSFFPMLAQRDVIAPHHISDLPDDLCCFLEPQDIQSVVWVPLYLDNRIEGFVGYDEVRGPRDWLPEEITMARFVSKSYSRALEREQTTRMLVNARDEAMRVAQLRAQFVANMSHEIRTPMTGTLGMLELLMETELDDLQREFASDAYASSAHLLEIINEILDFSKLEAGQVILEATPIDLNAIATEIKMTLTPQVKDKPVELRLEIDPALPYRIFGDATRIRQVLMNMVGNAVKFTQQGEVVLGMEVAHTVNEVASIIFSVRDTGIGISPENVQRIFDSFVQADGSTTRRFGGSGLGLSISKQLVELMGGKIEVESAPGEGSTFKFVLQLPVAQAVGMDKTRHTEFANLNVLLVDNNRTARYLLAQLLESWDVRVTQVSHTHDLKDLDASQSFDLAFLRCPGECSAATRKNLVVPFARQVVYVAEAEITEGDSIPFLKWPINQSSLYNLLVENIHTHLPGPNIKPDLSQVVGRVLLAEDHPLNVDLVLMALSDIHIQVDVVGNGQEALDQLERAPYDLVLMDIQMPVMSGTEATHRIRASATDYRDIPILALTASVMSFELPHYLGMGMNEVISKPFSVKRLREVVLNWLGKAQQTMTD